MILSNNSFKMRLTFPEDDPIHPPIPLKAHLPRFEHWINVRADFQIRHQHWGFVFPFFEEADAVWLLVFLDGLCLKKVPPGTSSHFIEPQLKFEFRGYALKQVQLKLHLRMQARPPWVQKDMLVLSLRFSERVLQQAATGLRYELQQIRPSLLLPPDPFQL